MARSSAKRDVWSLEPREGEGARDVTVCVAETQSAGGGRRGRAWQAPLGGNVYFSLLKRFSQGMGSLSGLSLVAGVALIDALTDCGIAGTGLKWPNASERIRPSCQ